MDFCFSELPVEIIDKILSYNGSIKYRNGKFMNQISKTDQRYHVLLTTIPKYYFCEQYDTFGILIDFIHPNIVDVKHNSVEYWRNKKSLYIFYENKKIEYMYVRYLPNTNDKWTRPEN